MSNQFRSAIHSAATLLVVTMLLGLCFIFRYDSPGNAFGSRSKDTPIFIEDCEARTAGEGTGAAASTGFVIGWDFGEGQTCASRNLLGLIHWANDLNLTVVEPCVYNSFFNLANCIDAVNHSTLAERQLSFRDYFDIDYWNNQTLSHNIGAPLLAWENFILNMPTKEAIIVYIWRLGNKKNVKATVFINDEIERYAVGCYPVQEVTKPQFTKEKFAKLGIKITREVCFRFNNFVPMSVQWFDRQIFGSCKPSNVLIVFAQWPGAFRGAVYLDKAEYGHTQAFSDYIRPSPRVIEDSRKYAEQFLGGSNYVAVHLRTMKMATALKHKSQKYIVEFITKHCNRQVSTVLQKLKGKRFLALDLGKFGDHDPDKVVLTNDSVNVIVVTLLSSVYGGEWNQTEWEDSFVQATSGITDSGYIAMMQKVLASNADCIVVGGGGEFHKSLMNQYIKKTKNPCMHKVCEL